MKTKRKHGITADSKMHPELKKQVQTLCGGMVGAAEKYHLPERFNAEPDQEKPTFTITDSLTGRSTTVGLCNYGGVRQALHDLFGDIKEKVS